MFQHTMIYGFASFAPIIPVDLCNDMHLSEDGRNLPLRRLKAIRWLGSSPILKCTNLSNSDFSDDISTRSLSQISKLQLSGKLTQVPEMARYHGEIYGNISLNSEISWGRAAPRPPRGFPRVLGHGGDLKNMFLKV